MRVRMSRDFRSLVDRVNRMEWPSQNAIPAEDRWAYTPEAIASLRRPAGGLPLLDRLGAQRPMRRVRPADVVEVRVIGVLRGRRDEPLLVLLADVGLAACDEAGAERDALRPKIERRDDPAAVRDPT